MVVFLLAIDNVHASGGYPAEIQSYLALDCRPTCTICHEDNRGGRDTVTRAFGAAMIDRGLEGDSSYELLHAAVDAMQADGVDSDGDTTPDVDELAEGTDPNPGGASFCVSPTPIYGCASAAGATAGGAVLSLALATFVRRPRNTGGGDGVGSPWLRTTSNRRSK
jgi:hypothetical protein